MTHGAFVLVDDDKIVLDSLKAQLREAFGHGYLYEVAEDVPEAWEVIDELVDDGARVVVVVSDWLMPGIKGDQFLVDVRERHPEVVRILLTGQADDSAVRRAREVARVHEVFHKPWNITELTQSIGAALA